MESHIVCPNCQRIISKNPIIQEAVKGTGSIDQSIICDCGERITYWRVTALLRKQKSAGNRFKNWMRTLFNTQAKV